MGIYDDMQQIGRELLNTDALGQDGIFLISVAAGVGPIDDPAPGVETRHDLKGGAARGVSFKYIQSGLALASDTQVTWPVLPGVPDPVGQRDFLEVKGVRYKIIEVIRKPQAGTTVVFTAIARR